MGWLLGTCSMVSIHELIRLTPLAMRYLLSYLSFGCYFPHHYSQGYSFGHASIPHWIKSGWCLFQWLQSSLYSFVSSELSVNSINSVPANLRLVEDYLAIAPQRPWVTVLKGLVSYSFKKLQCTANWTTFLCVLLMASSTFIHEIIRADMHTDMSHVHTYGCIFTGACPCITCIPSYLHTCTSISTYPLA